MLSHGLQCPVRAQKQPSLSPCGVPCEAGVSYGLYLLFALTENQACIVCEVRKPKGNPGQSKPGRNVAATHGSDTQS